MIVLNTEKGPVRIERWDDLLDRPAFEQKLDRTRHELKAIVGHYQFFDKVPCGLSDCGVPHNRGYLVETTDGRETNIGNVCGKIYFGAVFEALKANYERAKTEADNREAVTRFLANLPALKQQIAHLRTQSKGANWIYEGVEALHGRCPGCAQSVIKEVATLVKARRPMLTRQRPATEREISLMEVAQGRDVGSGPYYVDEPVAQIAGIDALYAENDLKKLLVYDLQMELKRLEEEDVDVMSFAKLKHWAKWIGTVEATLERARVAVDSGRRLLTADNLHPFSAFLRGDKEKQLFAKFLKR